MYPLLGYDEAIQDFYPLGYRLWLWCPGAIHQNRGQNQARIQVNVCNESSGAEPRLNTNVGGTYGVWGNIGGRGANDGRVLGAGVHA